MESSFELCIENIYEQKNSLHIQGSMGLIVPYVPNDKSYSFTPMGEV